MWITLIVLGYIICGMITYGLLYYIEADDTYAVALGSIFWPVVGIIMLILVIFNAITSIPRVVVDRMKNDIVDPPPSVPDKPTPPPGAPPMSSTHPPRKSDKIGDV
jgi:hypothetical protein